MPGWVDDALSGYAIRRDHETNADAVERSIARRTGLEWCGGPRSDGLAVHGDVVTAAHYAGTLGRPCFGGGWSPVADVWFSVPS